METLQWTYLVFAALLALYVASVIDAAASASRRRLWNAPPNARPPAAPR